MPLISGTVTNKFGQPIDKVMVALMDKDFEKIYETYTNEYGNYEIQIKEGSYPYLIVVKDYGMHFLEYWCQDITLRENLIIDASIDKLEIYGLNVFKIDGAYPGLMIYFRPMSLEKFLEKESDIYPEIKEIQVKINGEILEIYHKNEVKEYGGNSEYLKACLLHVSIPKEGLKSEDNYLSIQVIDRNNNLGQASIFFTLKK